MVDDIPWVSIGLLARVRPCFSGHVWRVLDFFKCHKCLGDYRCYRTGNPHVFTEQSWTIHRSLRILPVTNPLILPLFEHLPSLRLVVQQKRSTMLQEDNRLRQSSDARNSVQKQSFLCYPRYAVPTWLLVSYATFHTLWFQLHWYVRGTSGWKMLPPTRPAALAVMSGVKRP